MTHSEMVQMFIDDRFEDGNVYFKNVNRVIHQILCKREDSFKVANGEAASDYNQPKEIQDEISLAFCEARQYLLDVRDEKLIAEHKASLRAQRAAAEKYYAKYGTQGEF